MDHQHKGPFAPMIVSTPSEISLKNNNFPFYKSLLLPLAMFGVAVTFYLYEFLLRVAPNSMFAHLMRDFNIDSADLGLLYSAYFLPYAFLQLPVGAWTDKFGPRRLLTFAILLCSISTLLFAKTDSFLMACSARFFIGAGSAFAFISCMKIITVWFPPHFFPILTGLTLTFGSLGAVAGVSSVAFALELVSWRELFLILGVIGLFLAALSWCIIRDGQTNIMGPLPNTSGKSLSFWESLRTILRAPQNWMIAVYAFMTTAPTDALGGLWGTSYLVQVHHIENTLAATCVSMTFVGMAIGSPLMGWLSSQHKSRKLPMLIGASCATLSLIALLYAPTLSFATASLLFFAFGLFGTYVMSFVVIRDVNTANSVGTAVGFVNGASMLGSTILSSFIGLLLRKLSNGFFVEEVAIYTREEYQTALISLPIFYALTTLIIIPFIKESYQNTSVKLSSKDPVT